MMPWPILRDARLRRSPQDEMKCEAEPQRNPYSESEREFLKRGVSRQKAFSRRESAGFLPSGPKFQAFQTSSDIEADLALQTEWLQRNRIRRTTHQQVSAGANTDGRAALRAGIVARKIAWPKPRDR